MSNLDKDAAEYMKGKNEYSKIMNAILEKYKKTGKVTGKIKLSDISKEERLLIGAVDKTLYDENEVNISVKKFRQYFCSGKYENTDLFEIMKFYFGEQNIKTRREHSEEKDILKESFFAQMMNKLKSYEVKIWLEAVMSIKKFGYTSVIKLYNENKKELKYIIFNIDKAFCEINLLSEDYIPLAKFSSLVTKDSHYFDIDTTAGKMFINVIGYIYNMKTDNARLRNEALMKVKIIRDEVSNFTITYGLMAYDEKSELQGYEWFRREKQPLLLNIYNLNFIKEIKAVHDKVYVFENPTVFYELMKKTAHIPVSLICTSGQLNVSSMILLEKLRESKAEIYYSGDFDPEGLQIASSIKYRYGDSVKFLGMNIENYHKTKGSISFDQRAGKLDSIGCAELKGLADEMKKYCQAGYQELLIDYYYDYIVKNNQI